MIKDISKLLCQFISISEEAMAGITSNSLSEWQEKHGQNISEIAKLPPLGRLDVVKELFCMGKENLKNLVPDSQKDKELFLDIAYDKGFKLYLEHAKKYF